MTTAPQGLQARLTRLLEDCLDSGDYRLALVCTDRGLPIAAAGGGVGDEELSALVAVFEEVVRRVGRDLGRARVDELTVLDADLGRLVVRPIQPAPGSRLFLVLDASRKSTWRRNTNKLCRALASELGELCTEGAF